MTVFARRASIWKRLAGIDKRFCWSFVGVIVGIYFGVYYKRAANLSIDVLSNTNIADITQDSKNLDILYDGKSIKAAGNALSVLVVRIANDGNAPIRMDSFTPDAPFGFNVPDGTLIDVPQIIGASNDYLRKAMTARYSEHTVTFAPVIMRPGDYVGFKILAIHGASPAHLSIAPIGIVADVSEISVRRLYETQPVMPIWEQVVGGGVVVNALRFTLSICVVVVMIIISTTLDGIAFQRKVRQQRLKIRSFIKQRETPENAGQLRELARQVEESGYHNIQMMFEALDRLSSGQRLTRWQRALLSSNGFIKRTTDPVTNKRKYEVSAEARKLLEDFMDCLK